MKVIKQAFELWQPNEGIKGLLQHVEKCGRLCYNSLSSITEDSTLPFIEMLVKRGHTSVLEHGTVYLIYKEGFLEEQQSLLYIKLLRSRFTVFHVTEGGAIYLTTNLRAILEIFPELFNKILYDTTVEFPSVQILTEPTEHHIKRYSVHLTCDIGSLTDYRTHRVFSRDDVDSPDLDASDMSTSAESTRYVNYTKEKNGGELTFIQPYWFDLENYNNKELKFEVWSKQMQSAENAYKEMIALGCSPQEARDVLPKATKTEMVLTANAREWKNFFKLRTAPGAHPQEVQLLKSVESKFNELNMLNE